MAYITLQHLRKAVESLLIKIGNRFDFLNNKVDTLSESLDDVAFSGDYDDLINKPSIPTVPTNISAFNNDSGYVTHDYDYRVQQTAMSSTQKSDYPILLSNISVSNMSQYIGPVGKTNTLLFNPSTGLLYTKSLSINTSSGELKFGCTSLKADSDQSVANTITVPSSTGTLALTSDIPSVPSWALQSTKPSYTASEVGALGSDVPAAAITSADIDNWNAKSATDEKLKTYTSIATSTTYYPIIGSFSTTASTKSVSKGLSFVYATLILGHNGADDPICGKIQLNRGYGNYSIRLEPDLSNSSTINRDNTLLLPARNGTLALVSDIPSVPSWALQSTKPSYTADEVGALSSAIDVATKEYVNTAIGNINGFEVAVVNSLPTENIDTHTFYFMSNSGSGNNIYDEYLYINNAWEKIGSTEIDLSGYLLSTDIADWAKASTKPSYTANEVGALPDSTDLSVYMQKSVDYVTAGRKANTTAGTDSTAEGSNTTSSSFQTHAEGSGTTASASQAHAEGMSTTASGIRSHAEGMGTTASGSNSHSEGYQTMAAGSYSHSEGLGTYAYGESSHTSGSYTTAYRKNQFVFGRWNIVDGNSPTTEGTYVEIVGNGTTNDTRSNARTLDWSGNEVLAGKLTVGAGPTNNMDVATKQYVDTAIPTIPTTVSSFTNDAGYITSYTETDPIFSASAAASITSTDISNWNAKSDTDEKVKITSLNGLNGSKPVLFGSTSFSGAGSRTESVYTSNKILYNDYSTPELSIYSSDTNKHLGLANDRISFAQSLTIFGNLHINTLTATRNYYLPDKTGTIALTSDIPTVPTNISAFTNDAGYLTSYTETDPTVPAWAKAASKPTYTASEVGALADTTDVTKWNGVSLNKSTYYNTSATYYVPVLASTSATESKLLYATASPGVSKLATYDENSYLHSMTPSASDNSTKVATTAYVDSAINELGSLLTFKEIVATTGDLPGSGNDVGDVWVVSEDNSEHVWTGDAWERLGTTVDLSGYVPTSRKVNNKALSTDITLSASDVGAQASITANGILKGNGSGTITAATAGTDYVAPSALSSYMQKGVDYVTAGKKSGTSLGTKATAEGNNNTASGNWSHAEGNTTTASAQFSHAEGGYTIASGSGSHAEGEQTIANHANQHVFGSYNIADSSEAGPNFNGTYIEIVGNGTEANARSNARTLDWSGNEVLAGKLTVGAGPTNAMDVATKTYVDTAIPTIPTTVSSFTNDAGYITSYTETDPIFSASAAASITSTDITNWNNKLDTDEKVKQVPLNGTNSTKGLLFSKSTGASQKIDYTYTSDKLQWNDYSSALFVYNGDGTKFSQLSFDGLRLMNSTTSYQGALTTANITAHRSYTLPDKTGTIALTSDIPNVPSWALASTKPTYTASEVGAVPSEVQTGGGSQYGQIYNNATTGINLVHGNAAGSSQIKLLGRELTLASTKSQGNSSIVLKTNNTNVITLSEGQATIIGVVTPTTNDMAANKGYVDSAISALTIPTRYNSSTNTTGYLTMADLPIYDGTVI